ncbi:MAG: glycogen synthase GlgA [Planctomycetaceae bacterium]|nr:glycogen synthase GlgA [Planctomycetaceae bacterium]
MTEQIEKARAETDAAERGRRKIEDEIAQQEARAAERARQLAAENAADSDTVSERLARAAAHAGENIGASTPPAPPIEVENPFWQQPPEIFDVLSGAPHGAETPDYIASLDTEASLPVTMTPTGGEQRQFAPQGSFVPDEPGESSLVSYAVPLEKRMYIVMVTPEVAPAAKVGGLGDVILGLGRELMKRGHGVEVICPMYSGMRYDLIDDLHEEYGELWCPHYNEWRPEKVFQGKVGGDLQVNFITGGTYTERPNIYGYDDDLQRFAYFSRAALEFMFKTNRRPEIIHCHDWATGLVPPILWDIYQKLGWNNSRVVYTIHNNECQGLCGFGDKLLGLVGLDVREHHRPDRMQDDTHKNCINMMKSGIVYSNFVTTVSPTYAGELKSAAGGRGLQTTIAKNSAKVGGVLNGIDYESWNPATDVKLAARYSAGDDFFEKYRNKAALREWLGLWDAWRPIIGVVTRLTHQKGLDLIKHAIYAAQGMQAQFVLLGSAPDPKVNNDFLAIQHQLRDNHDVSLYIGYHEDLSHIIYAGADMFLVPSLYEPCGLTQMISLRYGTVPIVRETGGLVDTVFDLDNSGLGLNEVNGFTFRDPTPASLDYGLGRAVQLWYDNPEAFNRLARNGMRYDYSWRHPTEHYENIYNYVKA